MKTAKEWFESEHFASEVGQMAIENTKKRILNKEFPTPTLAVKCSFLWRETKQGMEFWEEVYNNLCNK